MEDPRRTDRAVRGLDKEQNLNRSESRALASSSNRETRIRQTANRVKGPLRRMVPPLTRSAVCLIPDIRAKRSYASLTAGTLY